MPDSPSLVIPARSRSIGAFTVDRLLPSRVRRSVGPFVFIDRMGPLDVPPGRTHDVLPHPHIGLATVTYLFDGGFVHRDSEGHTQLIEPGAVNWMTAGRGIAHSERMPESVAQHGGPLDGMQTWVALPKTHETIAPSFTHHPAASIPDFALGDARARLVVGRACGYESPATVFAETLMVHLRLRAGGRCVWEPGQHEVALQVARGHARVNGHEADRTALLVFEPGARLVVEAASDVEFMLFGGEPIDGPRLMWWNFVSSDRERLQDARTRWENGHFPLIPGDDVEFVPAPEGPLPALR